MRNTKEELALHGGLEYRPTPTGWLHHRHRLHLLRPTSCLPIHAAYPAPSGWRHAQDASGVKLPRTSLSSSFPSFLSHSLFLFCPSLYPSYTFTILSVLTTGLSSSLKKYAISKIHKWSVEQSSKKLSLQRAWTFF